MSVYASHIIGLGRFSPSRLEECGSVQHHGLRPAASHPQCPGNLVIADCGV